MHSKLLFLGSALILDLYLFQAIASLNAWFKCSKNLMLSFKEKVTTGHKVYLFEILH